jgi:hypothetical protein
MGLAHGTVSPGPPFEVGDFGPGVERSAKGAIHFRPRRVWHITPDELAHIETAHPDLAGRLVVLKRPGAQRRATAPAPEPAPPADIAAADPVDEDVGAKTEEDPGGGETGGAEDSGKDEEKPRKRRSRKKSK